MKGLMATGNLTVCPLPLRLDTYSGCPAGCAYCFARTARLSVQKHDTWGTIVQTEPPNEKVLRGEGASAEAGYRRMGLPVHMGGMADPFQPCEREAKASLRSLELLAACNVPTVVSTKFGLLAESPWREAWEAIPRRLLQVSLLAADDRLAKLEPDAPTWRERLAFVAEMAQTGPVAVRLQPFVQGFSEKTLGLLCERLASAGAKALIVEGLKVPVRVRPRMEALLGAALGGDFVIPSLCMAGDMCYPLETQFAYQLFARRLAKQNGLQHYAADNALRFLGDSPNCCATDLIDAPTWKANWGHVAEESQRSGEVSWSWLLEQLQGQAVGSALGFYFNSGNGAEARRWSEHYAGAHHPANLGNGADIRNWANKYGTLADTNPSGFQVNTGNGAMARDKAKRYGDNKQSLASWYRYVWNRTRAGRGPQSIMPNLVAVRRDDAGDAVYKLIIPERMREAVLEATGEKILCPS